MSTASARDLFRAGRVRQEVTIPELEKPIEVIALTVNHVQDFMLFTKKHPDDPLLGYAWLIRKCCPAFRWTRPATIKRKLSQKVMLHLAEKLMEVSGIGLGAVEDAEKKS